MLKKSFPSFLINSIMIFKYRNVRKQLSISLYNKKYIKVYFDRINLL